MPRHSPFAVVLTRLLDETKFYTRFQWANFLGTTTALIVHWANDEALPRPDQLRMILDLLTVRGGKPAAPVIAAFEEIAQQPATAVSPLGAGMAPTVRHYMTRTLFLEIHTNLTIEQPKA